MPRPDRPGPRPQHTHPGALHAFVLTLVLFIALLIAAAPASAYSSWKHSTATSKSSCTAGCHARTTPTNVACTRCHTGFTARGTQKCWDCHKPGQATSAWQLAAGCTTTCHISTRPTGQPTYTTPYTHAPTVHDGASAYGRTCVQCHGVSAGAAAPGSSAHHDAADSPAPTCAGCHDGGIASAPAGHGAYGSDCASCHSGMKRPSSSCSSCHVGRTGTSAPQITYANTLACADGGCHGKVVNHGVTPIGAAPCSTCHAAHYQALGGCQTCHPDPQSFHHRTAAARPLTDCAGCHDGGIAADRTTHGTLACSACHTDMGRPAVPAVCSQCHPATRFGTAMCTACHSTAGMTGREQVHAETPKAGVTCITCHAGHNADLGACSTCHGLVPEAHHGVVAPASSALRVEASPSTLAAGGAAVVRGTLQDAAGTALAGVEVLLQSRPFSQTAFTEVASLTTGADGSFSQPVRPAVGTEYRAVFKGAASESTVRRPATACASIAVKQTARLAARPNSVRRGARVRLSGAVAPTAQQLGAAASAVTLRVERKTSSGWRKVAGRTVAPRTDGTFSWTWRPRKVGAYRVRATAAPSPELLAGLSPWVAVKVR